MLNPINYTLCSIFNDYLLTLKKLIPCFLLKNLQFKLCDFNNMLKCFWLTI